jgi:hypothetical protein
MLSGQTENVMFQAVVTDAVGHIVKQTSEQPPKYLVNLLFRNISDLSSCIRPDPFNDPLDAFRILIRTAMP